MELRRWLGGLLAVTACGTVDPGPLDPNSTLSIREISLPGAVVGRHYEDQAVTLAVEGAHGTVQWSLPLLPSSLAWLSVASVSFQLGGLPLDLVAPAAVFVAQVTDGTDTARRELSLGVACREGSRTPCGVPDPAEERCVAGSRVCLGATLGACEPDVGEPPYEADPTHCGATCNEVCPRTSANRCLGVCMCGSAGAPCEGATPACCPGSDGRPEGFACASLQSAEHCGSCQKSCPATHPASGAHVDTTIPATCESGHCSYACQFPWGDCSGGSCRLLTTEDDADGCETDFSNPQTCGGTQQCPGINNGFATCSQVGGVWTCGLACNAGFDPSPCGMPPVCRPLSDPDNCGRCGRTCPTIDDENQKQICSTAGSCCVQVCDPDRQPPCAPVVCTPPP
jgi:hypothetical protein